jgi:ABC-type multidrug transport system fused ATPase/permease subunit
MGLQDIYKETVSYFSSRFALTIGLPCLFFWMGIGYLVVARDGINAALSTWLSLQPEIQVFALIVGAVWVVLFAEYVAANLGAILNFYEGYWSSIPGLKDLGKRRQKYHQDVIAALASHVTPETETELYTRYPPQAELEKVMPTRLGNILKSAEVYPTVRYKADGVLIWSRLYHVLPEALVSSIANAKANLDMMLVVSVLGGAFAFVGGVLAFIWYDWSVFLLCFWGGQLIAWLGYEGAVRNALPFTQIIKTVFDLHRITLIKQLNVAPPKSYRAERSLWEELSKLWVRGAPSGEEGAKLLAPPSDSGKKDGGSNSGWNRE